MTMPLTLLTRSLRSKAIAAAILLLACAPRPAGAADQVYFSAVDDVAAQLVQRINAETVRIDMSAWYLTDSTVYTALLNRFRAGVQVRLIGDRGSIFEIDPSTKSTFYYLASQGVPIRLRYNPTWYPEIDHWKATIFVGQGIVAFGSANYTTFELTPWSPTNYKDEITLFTSDTALVNAFKTKFDKYWHDADPEPQSLVPSAPYFKNWDDACASESACSDYRVQYPNPVPMVVDTARLEPDSPLPPEMVWGQGSSFNNRLVQEINKEPSAVDFVVYRLTVDNITQALLAKKAAGVPVRLIVEPDEYLNRKWPEFWITHANVDKLWAAGLPMRVRTHTGLTHMKVLLTSTIATIASSNYAAAWQRDHNYFLQQSAKPAIWQAIKDRFDAMWTSTDFAEFQPQPPDAPTLASPAAGASNVATTPVLMWNRATFATDYDVYLGTNQSALPLVGNVPAQIVNEPPETYSFVVSQPLASNTVYYWKIVSRTFATPRAPNMVASSGLRSFTTGSADPGGSLPSPWLTRDVGSTGVAGAGSYSGGTFSVSGAGADIWGAADAFRYVYQNVNGDVEIIARLASIQNTNSYAKAGVMLRESLQPGSRHIVLDVRPGGSVEFMTRSSTNGATSYLSGGMQPPPAWLKLSRSGNTVTGYISSNGSSWTQVGSTSTSMGAPATIGLIVSSHSTVTLNTSTFDNVTVTTDSGTPQPPAPPASPSPASGATDVNPSTTLTWSAANATSYDVRFGTSSNPPQVASGLTTASYAPSGLTAGTTYYWQIVATNGAGSTSGPVWSFTTAAAAAQLPSPWTSQDVGSTGLAGSASYSSGVFTVAGAGADIWGAADGFQYVSQSTSGDVEIVARVTAIQNTNVYAKAGVMLRESLQPGARHVILDVRPDGSIEFMTRTATNGATSYLAGTTQHVPAWLKLSRSGSTITGYVSANGSSWTTVGTATTTIPASARIGLIVTSHDTGTRNTSTFDNVGVSTSSTPPPPPPASDVVIYAGDVPDSALHGWIKASDAASPSSVMLATDDTGAANTNNPVASPSTYFDVSFDAEANVPYTIWLRLKALNNSKYNDAVWVQFSDALHNGAPIYPINSTSGLLVNLATDASASSLNGWGWQNTAYWLAQATTVTFPASGAHTMRIQIREDGVQLDQIVLSPNTYLGTPPGSVTNDSTIVPKP